MTIKRRPGLLDKASKFGYLGLRTSAYQGAQGKNAQCEGAGAPFEGGQHEVICLAPSAFFFSNLPVFYPVMSGWESRSVSHGANSREVCLLASKLPEMSC